MTTGGHATGRRLRAKLAGWEIVYVPEAVVYYQPVETYHELRSDYVRTAIAQAQLFGDLSEPVPRGVVGRAAAASLRQQPLNASAWLALRMRLWSERSVGLMRPDEVYARWGRLPKRLAAPPAVPGLGTSPRGTTRETC